jgi:hypothetical protein
MSFTNFAENTKIEYVSLLVIIIVFIIDTVVLLISSCPFILIIVIFTFCIKYRKYLPKYYERTSEIFKAMPRKLQIKLLNFLRGSSRSIIMNNYKHCEAVDFKINKSFKSQFPNDSFVEQ